MDRERHPPHDSLKHNMQYVVLNKARAGTFAEYTCIKAVSPFNTCIICQHICMSFVRDD